MHGYTKRDKYGAQFCKSVGGRDVIMLYVSAMRNLLTYLLHSLMRQLVTHSGDYKM